MSCFYRESFLYSLLMTQKELFTPIESTKFDSFSRSEIVKMFEMEQDLRVKLQKEISHLRSLLPGKRETKSLFLDEQYILLKSKLFGKSSEKESQESKPPRKLRRPQKKVQLPSERYPNVPVVEQNVELKKLPECSCCGKKMKDSGMTEDNEQLTVIPKKYFIIRQKRHKYSCTHCHGSLKTAPSLPRIKPKSSYSDNMMLDVALSKYCDLIPMERYSAMAGRGGAPDIPRSRKA